MDRQDELRKFHPSATSVVTSIDPEMTEEKAEQQHEELKALTREGEYELVETKQHESGTVVRVYRFWLADGTCMHWGSDLPIEESELAK